MDKNSFRKRCKELLSRAYKKNRYIKNFLVMTKVDEIVKQFKPKSILFYTPLKIEPDLTKLMARYRKNKQIYLPFIEAESFKMVKYRLPLKKNNFNVYEPKNSCLKIDKVDMVIVPVIGVDGDFKRVGFGKGMYDRFFEKLKNRPIVIFVQLDKCFTKQKVTSYHDISCDFYITPK